MSEAKRSPQAIISEALSLVSEDLDALRDELRNSNKPVIEAIGRVLMKLDAVQADLTSYQRATNEEIAKLRKKASNGSPFSE